MRTNSLIIILSCCITTLFSQNNCYTTLRQTGIDYYNSGKYDDAISAWNSSKTSDAKGCKPPANHDLDIWIAKAKKAKKFNATRLEAQRAIATAPKNYDLAISKWNESRQYASSVSEIKEINDNIKRIEETRPYTFIIRPVEMICVDIDDGQELVKKFPPIKRTDTDGEIYGQISMQIQNAGNFPPNITSFWKITQPQAQGMTKGKPPYPLLNTFERRITIVGNAIRTAQFTLITNGRSSDNQANGIYERDPNSDDDSFGEGVGGKSITLDLVKAAGRIRQTCKFKSGSGELYFVYEIQYVK